MPAKIVVLMVGKKIKGRKRHIVVDILGCLLSVVVHAANIHDTKAGWEPAAKAFDKYPTIERFCGDAGYRGTFEKYVSWDFDDVGVDISMRIKPEFEILPKRWIVKRTNAWFGNSRRLSKDYEISTDSAENMVILSPTYFLEKILG